MGHAGSAGDVPGHGKGLAFWLYGTNGTKKDVILKNEPKKLFRFSKRLHR
jgi:hypothetical protein